MRAKERRGRRRVRRRTEGMVECVVSVMLGMTGKRLGAYLKFLGRLDEALFGHGVYIGWGDFEKHNFFWE